MKEGHVLKKDVRAPLVEFAFDLQSDAQQDSGTVEAQARVNFNKVQLQAFFEELEKVQLKLDELTN